MTKISFPIVPIGEWTALRPYTASGLYAYRHLQAIDLLKFPDFSGGDLTKDQINDALKNAVYFHRPLTALSLFLSVVSLEDFIREIGQRISKIENLDSYFDKIKSLDIIPNKKITKPSSRHFRDPINNLLDFRKLNELYIRSIGINPISNEEIPRLDDLALIRHTVAHNGSVVREIDVPRFQYYQVTPNQILNPPIEFVIETCTYLYKTGRQFEIAIQKRIFQEIIPKLEKDWQIKHPKLLIDLIEVFNYFGKIPTDSSTFIITNEDKKKENDRIYHEIVDLCIKDLSNYTKS